MIQVESATCESETSPGIVVPSNVRTLRSFRRWTQCNDFSETGKISWLNGRIVNDQSPERLFSHNLVRGECLRALANWNRRAKRGIILGRRMRYASVPADLATEPDLFFVSYASLRMQRARFIPSADRRDFTEVEGELDLAVEFLSPTSKDLDQGELKQRYYAAGVKEYWIVDAMERPPTISIHSWSKDGFVAAKVSGAAARSKVLMRWVTLQNRTRCGRLPDYELSLKRTLE